MARHQEPYTRADFEHSPLMFYYEVTQACDLVCAHCRASAQVDPVAGELSHDQSLRLIDQVASFPRRPTMVMTGGDPLKRADIFELIAYAAEKNVPVALTPSATPLATLGAFRKAQASGVRRLGISLDGADALTHDAFRGWCGSFERTLGMLEDAGAAGLSVQVNTTVTRRNVEQLDAIAELLASRDIAMWSVFFLVPVGRGVNEERIRPEEYEMAFERLWRCSRTHPFAVKTTEAPHYRRFVMQRGGNPLAGRERPDSGHPRGPLGVGDGKGIMFVSHTGEIFPAGFLPLSCGRFPENSVVDVYRHHAVFLDLRDPDRFKGNCGICEYRHICGGSRSRAYAVAGDYMETEPDCVYRPAVA